MLSQLTKTATASVLAVALFFGGITATATPAAANGHRNNNGAEAAAILGGLLLLYGLSQSGRNTTITRHAPPPQAVIPLHPFPPPHPVFPVYPHPPRNLRVAPAHCLVEGYDHSGYYRGYRARCIEQSVPAPHLLPAQCLRTVWTDRGQRRIYGSHCLSRNGWIQG